MRRNAGSVAAVACLCAAFGGCGSVNSMLGGNSEESALAALKWSYAKGAVVIEIAADADLNLHDGRPHTLVLAVGQSADPNAFLTLLGEPVQLAAALQTGRVAGMLSFERIVVSPGRNAVVNLDRLEGARHVGVVAYYQHGTAPGIARLFRIPAEVVSEGIVVRKRVARPQVLGLRLKLGAAGLTEAHMLNPGASEPDQAIAPAEQPPRNDGVITAREVQDAMSASRAAQRLAQ